MDENLTEQQQIEMLKKVWKEYGWSVIIGVTLAIIVGFGWRYYQGYITHRAERASVVYEIAMIDFMNNHVSSAKVQANTVIKQYARTPYAQLASMMLAKIAVDQKDLDAAVQHLSWAVHHASSLALKQIAQIRLARVYIAHNKSQKALLLLEKIHDQAFAGLSSEIKGDAYSKLGEMDKAKQSYQAALKLLPADAVNRPFLQIKMHNLPSAD